MTRLALNLTLATSAAIFGVPEVRAEAPPPIRTGAFTFAGEGTVNTHWIETPGGGLVVIDVQRDLAHARQALAAVRASGKAVRAILITLGHPDHYAGVGLFKAALPDTIVSSSETTTATIRSDPYGFNALMRRTAGANFPQALTPPDRQFPDDATLEIDGLEIIAREMGRAEANSATVYYMPSTGDL